MNFNELVWDDSLDTWVDDGGGFAEGYMYLACRVEKAKPVEIYVIAPKYSENGIRFGEPGSNRETRVVQNKRVDAKTFAALLNGRFSP